jgi:hypothetical protein
MRCPTMCSVLCCAVPLQSGAWLSQRTPGHDFLSSCRLPPEVSVDSRWGDVSLVQAFITSLGQILQRCPNAQHIGLASGHDVPLQLVG